MLPLAGEVEGDQGRRRERWSSGGDMMRCARESSGLAMRVMLERFSNDDSLRC